MIHKNIRRLGLDLAAGAAAGVAAAAVAVAAAFAQLASGSISITSSTYNRLQPLPLT